jgi:hypothetical protein
MSDLVTRLSTGRHPVSVARYKSADELERAVAQGFVLVKFTGTRGGTELGFKIDAQKSNVDAKNSAGKLQLVGPLTLDYVRVECDVEVDVETLDGTGVLKPLDAAPEVSSKTTSTTARSQRKASKATA